jgi:hypothetical protein
MASRRLLEKFLSINVDKAVKSLLIVMPELIRHPEPIEFTGFRRLPWTPIQGSPNDRKMGRTTFYETIKVVR